MKRIIIATLSTLVLSTLVAPSAKAIRPVLLGQSASPTISEEIAPIQTPEVKNQPIEKVVVMPTEKSPSNKVQSQKIEEPPFEYFENFYREKYGS